MERLHQHGGPGAVALGGTSQRAVLPGRGVQAGVRDQRVALPDGRGAHFFNLWAGKTRNPRQYRADLREDITQVFALLRDGTIEVRIDSVFPLRRRPPRCGTPSQARSSIWS